ncbi:MAG: radical SAM protein [Promethearchaeota archaeon]
MSPRIGFPNIFTLPFIKQATQALGRNFIKYCPKCSSNRFDIIMNYLFGKHDRLCFNCRLQATIFKTLISQFFTFFKIDSDTVEKLCADIVIRKVLKNYFKGLAIFGGRIPHVTGAPLSVVWNYTKKCNMKCPHCFSDAQYNQKSENELSTEEAKRVIDILEANDVIAVNFCGGEPLMRDDVFEVMKYTHDHGIIPSISTNATLLSKEVCQNLHNSGVRSLDISLDSVTPKIHDRLRGMSGSYEMAVNGIINAVEFGKYEEIILNTTLTDFNAHEIPQIYEFAKVSGATKYYVSSILPTGRGKKYIKHDVSHEIKKKVMNFMATKFIQHAQGRDELLVLGRGMPYYSRACDELSHGNIYPVCEIITGYEPQYQNLFNGKAANFIHALSSVFSGCATGLFYIGLDCDGMLIPCAPADHIKLGSILKKGLYEIWVNHPLLNKIRDRKKTQGKCATCHSKKYCGGCRLTAYGLTGNWQGSDLSCPY